MKTLEQLLAKNKKIRVIGFDDAPFRREQGSPVKLSGIVCSNTRFEGMLWGEVTKDGTEATDILIKMVKQSKFYSQINVVLTDGIAVGGFNIIDLPRLSNELSLPCIAVMRKKPDLEAIFNALTNFSDYELRKQLINNAGPIYAHHHLFFQVQGCSTDAAARVLSQLTDTGNVPEALRLAHLIGSAIMTGQSSNRA